MFSTPARSTRRMAWRSFCKQAESHVVAAWTWKTIFASYPTFILLFNLRTISDTELSFLDITLRITDDHISTTIYYKDTDTHTYLHHQSSHPSHCKKGLPRSQLLRLRRLCSEDSDFLEKGGEMVSFFEQRGYFPAWSPGVMESLLVRGWKLFYVLFIIHLTFWSF